MQTSTGKTKPVNKEINPANANSSISAFSELPTTVVIIHNISRNLTKRHLQEIFSFYGPLKGVFLPKEEESKLPKNYAYLEFLNKEDAEKACLYMGEGQIDGLKVKVEILTPPEKETNRERDKDYKRDQERNLHPSHSNKSHAKRRRSRSRSRHRSPSNKNRGSNYHGRHNRSRSNNRRHHRKGSYSSSSSHASSSESSNKSSSSS